MRHRFQKLVHTIRQYYSRQVVLLLITLLLPIIFSGGMAKWAVNWIDDFSAMPLYQQAGTVALLSIPLALSMYPNTLACLVLGYLLQWRAVLWLVELYALALILGYAFGQLTKKHRAASLNIFNSKKLTAFEELYELQSRLVFLSRFSPLLPFAATNLLLVWVGVRFKTFFIYSILGMLPRMLLLVWIATRVKNIYQLLHDQNTKTESWLIHFAFLSIGLVGYYMLYKQVQKIIRQKPRN